VSDFKIIIGLEIHAQLNTKSKMFCCCDNDSQGKKPNTVVCPICLGMPGTLPMPNKEAILKTLKLGKALSCEIPNYSKFDRKHYYYPDLPKGYQISQYDMPLCIGGNVSLELNGVMKSVKLNRIHLEEDAGKLIHLSKNTIVDLNRAGTPLVEIVTEPVISSPAEAKEFMRSLQKILRQLNVSNADMEKGHLRCDANISVIRSDQSSKIIEIKNLNSFKFVYRALEFEINRLTSDFEGNIGPGKQTRGFDSKRSQTYPQRLKEEASDYRYFPEPDIPTIDTTLLKIEEVDSELPSTFVLRVHEEYNLSKEVAKKLTHNLELMSCFIVLEGKLNHDSLKRSANWLANEKILRINPDLLVTLNRSIEKSEINSSQAKSILRSAVDEEDIVQQIKKFRSNDGRDIDGVRKIIDKVVESNKKEKEKYLAGKKQILGFFIGQVLGELKGNGNPEEISQMLKSKLDGK